MSTDINPNTKYVQITREVPRDPAAYRLTTHFGQRAHERIPDDVRRGTVIRETIQLGELSGATPPGEDHGSVCQHFAFERRVFDRRWRIIVGIRPVAFREPDEKHLAVTIMEVDDE